MDILYAITEKNQFGRMFQVRSSEALSSAILALVKYYKDPEDCLIKTVNWGGDADTVGAIVGMI